LSVRTVLVVDDEPHVRHILSFKLQDAGFTVLCASDGDEAWHLIMRHFPDLVVTDLQMGRVSGMELCQRMAGEERTENIPVIMLTARGHRLTEQELSGVNIKLVAPKPFSAREVVRHVCTQLGLPTDEARGLGASAA
jgi:DNA-binding response OmpR family regulator